MRIPFLTVLLVSGVAAAHAHLMSPVPRANEDIKVGPCGAPAGTTRASFTTGQWVEVQWTETIAHPGSYRVSFSPQGDQNFAPMMMRDGGLATAILNPPGTTVSQSEWVQMPAVPCEGCTVQLIQVMTDRNPPTNYYSCADVRVVVPDGGAGGGGGGAGGGGAGGGGAGGGGAGGGGAGGGGAGGGGAGGGGAGGGGAGGGGGGGGAGGGGAGGGGAGGGGAGGGGAGGGGAGGGGTGGGGGDGAGGGGGVEPNNQTLGGCSAVEVSPMVLLALGLLRRLRRGASR